MRILNWIKNIMKKDVENVSESVTDTMNQGLILGIHQYITSLPNSYFLQKGQKQIKRIRL